MGWAMTKTEHLQFLVLMIPTFLILAAAAVSMADLAFPAQQPDYTVASAEPVGGAEHPVGWDERSAE
jgi:hypothetical protein